MIEDHSVRVNVGMEIDISPGTEVAVGRYASDSSEGRAEIGDMRRSVGLYKRTPRL